MKRKSSKAVQTRNTLAPSLPASCVTSAVRTYFLWQRDELVIGDDKDLQLCQSAQRRRQERQLVTADGEEQGHRGRNSRQ